MAEVRNVKLAFLSMKTTTVEVKVDYELVFTADEIGKAFKLMIELFGVDSLSDTPTTIPIPGREEQVLTQLFFQGRLGSFIFCKNLASLKNDGFTIENVDQVLEYVH